MSTNEIQNFLTQIMRVIDKKATLTLDRLDPSEVPAVLVRLTHDRRVANLQINEDDIIAAQTDLIRRERIRVALKRAYDRMHHTVGHIYNTKKERPKMESMHWAPGSANRGGRR